MKMSILIKKIRIDGFRGLKDIEIDLERTTVLTGINNSGKSSVLRALQLAFGSYQFISRDDFHIKSNSISNKIIIDTLIIPVGENGVQCNNFDEDWEITFTENRIKIDSDGRSSVPFRTIVTFDPLRTDFKKEQFAMKEWPAFEASNNRWFNNGAGELSGFSFSEIPFFYVGAQRDITEDMRQKNSYLGKMLSKIEYSQEDLKSIEDQLHELNQQAVSSSHILSEIKANLEELNSAMDTGGAVEITPFTKRIRDLNKGLSIHYSDQSDSFSMEYHGMGTRSWSSLLALKAFVSLLETNSKSEDKSFFPIIAIEEPEAHLHPNAQKKLYAQIDDITGQKVISTHSPYVVSRAKINQLRHLYKSDGVKCGEVKPNSLSEKDQRNIESFVLDTRGELIFSQVVILFEGLTERKALPIFARRFFNKHPSDIGINFVEVGGRTNYLPFLKVISSLNIPWFVFSDADGDTVEIIKKQASQLKSSLLLDSTTIDSRMIFLDDGNNFEKQLINEGFEQQIRNAYKLNMTYTNEQHRQAKQAEIDSYDKEKLLKIMQDDKVHMSQLVAEKIIETADKMPRHVTNLFNKVKKLL